MLTENISPLTASQPPLARRQVPAYRSWRRSPSPGTKAAWRRS